MLHVKASCSLGHDDTTADCFMYEIECVIVVPEKVNALKRSCIFITVTNKKSSMTQSNYDG